ncbi:hypothetical protein NQZ68_033758 [Dissostichus eleginoides]|nr:hypothetical protein NQZ68_033758 [Dissostichus eleginoides]
MQEKSIRNTEPAQQSGVSCVSLWPRAADLQRTGPVWPSQLQPLPLRLDLSPNLHWLCVVLLKGISPQIIPDC